MTPVEIIAERVAPFWLADDQMTGNANQDAFAAMSRRYLKADKKSLTQFNTGALIVREGHVLAFTECQPFRQTSTIRLGPTTKSRDAVVDDIRRNGPPVLIVLFRKGAIDVASWVCSTPDEVVVNGPAGPDVAVMTEDVALIRTLKGNPRAWRNAAFMYARAEDDLSLATALYDAAEKLAAATGENRDSVLQCLHRLRNIDRLAYKLAEPPKGASS